MASAEKLLKSFLALCFWLLVWYVVATLVNTSLLIAVPTPLDTLGALASELSEPEFYKSVGMSVVRITLGYLLAVVLGTVCAVLSNRSELFKTLTRPLLHIIRAVPVASFIILVFLWLSKETIPVFISFLMVFPVVWGNVEKGLDCVDKELVEMARVMSMNSFRIFKEIKFPSVMPDFETALITGLGFAWKSGIAAEVICRTGFSVGNMLWISKNAIDYNEVFALTVVIVLLSIAFENILNLVFRRRKK